MSFLGLEPIGTAPWKVVSPTGGLVVELSSASIQAIESMAYGTGIKSVEDVWQNLSLTIALTSEPLTYWLKTKEAHPSAVALARAKSQSSQQDGEVTPGLIRRANAITSRLAAGAVFSRSYQHAGQYSALMPKAWKTKGLPLRRFMLHVRT